MSDPRIPAPEAAVSPAAEPGSTEGEEATKDCKFCASKLSARARFCTKCELFQRNWLRSKSSIGYFTLFNAMLSTIMALLVFLFQTMPQFGVLAYANPHASTPVCYTDEATISINNLGESPMVLDSGTAMASGVAGIIPDRVLKFTPATIDKHDTKEVTMEFLHPKSNRRYPYGEPALAEDGSSKECWISFAIKYLDPRKQAPQDLKVHTCTCTKSTHADEIRKQKGEAPGNAEPESSSGDS